MRAIGLDVGGVDFLSKDITESYRNIGGGICEVNAAPGFRMHVAPSEGKGRDVAAPVVSMLFPPGAPARVPIAAITGTNGKTTTARMLAHLTKMGGYTPGLTTTDGVYIDGQRTVQGDMTGPCRRAWCWPIRRSISPSSRPRAAACCAPAWACAKSMSAPC